MIQAPTQPCVVAPAGLYVYCVAHGADHHVFGPIGLDGQVVYTVGSGDIRAVVHNCPAQPYRSLDPETVEGWVLEHQNVVLAATGAFGTVLPMAFDMIVHGSPRGGAGDMLKAWLDEKHERFALLLAKVADRAEFAVQVLWDRAAVTAALLQEDAQLHQMQDQVRAETKGMAHVLQQKLTAAVRAALATRADRLAADSYDRIRRCVQDVRIDKLKKTPDGKQMLLNLSCLAREDAGELGRVLDVIQANPGVVVRFTGPWPPYSFVGG